MDFHVLIYDIAIIFGAATFGAIVTGFFKIPSIVGFVLAGVIVGPSGLGLLDSIPGAKIIAEFGVILLLFTIGLELSLKSLRLHKRLLLSSGLSQLLITGTIVLLIARFGFDLDLSQSIFWSFLISLSSTAIVMKLLVDTRDSQSTHGKAVTGILLTQDIAVIPMTLAIPLLASSHSLVANVAVEEVLEWFAKFLVVVAGVLLGARYVVPRFLESADLILDVFSNLAPFLTAGSAHFEHPLLAHFAESGVPSRH